MNVKKINTKYLAVTGAVLFVILIGTKNKIKKFMLFETQKDFIKFIYPYAKTIGDKIGVPAVFITSQICLETNYGKSSLFSKYFNVGGIKAVKGQNYISLPTYEYIKGVKTKINQNFAIYPDLLAGLVAYSKILQNKYFKQYLNKTSDANKYAELLQSGTPKYATDINYLSKIKTLNKIVSETVS